MFCTGQTTKTIARQNERREDAGRLRKLQTDMRTEDEQLLRDAEIMLEEYSKKGKNTLPIIKYVKVSSRIYR